MKLLSFCFFFLCYVLLVQKNMLFYKIYQKGFWDGYVFGIIYLIVDMVFYFFVKLEKLLVNLDVVVLEVVDIMDQEKVK